MRMHFARAAFVLGAMAMLAGPPPAFAGKTYWELGAGSSQIRGASPFFGSASDTLGLALAVELGFGYTMNLSSAATQLSVGLEHRTSQGLDGSTYYGVQSLYPDLRIEGGGFWVGFGVAPFVWKRSGGSGALWGYSHASGSFSYLGEAGYAYAMTPRIALTFGMSGEMIQTSSSYSPKPIISGMVGLRFIGNPFGDGSGASSSSRDFDEPAPGQVDPIEDQRYPYGVPKK